jgi:hypothetical protein
MKRKTGDRKLARGRKMSFPLEKSARMAPEAGDDPDRRQAFFDSRLSLVSNYSLGYMSFELTGMDPYLSLS